MSRKKRKEIWGYVIAEQEDGSWTWDTPFATWRWSDTPGLNLSARPDRVGDWKPLVMFARLEFAVYYSLGYQGGYSYGVNQERQQQQGKGEGNGNTQA
jgi:hypothetical protein